MDPPPEEHPAPPAGPGDIIVVHRNSTAVKLAPGTYLILSLRAELLYETVTLDLYNVLSPDGSTFVLFVGNLRRAVERGDANIFCG